MRLITITSIVFALTASCASGAPKVDWMAGFHAPGTPSRYDKVGVVEVGPRGAKNVLVLEPGTSAGGAYFVPLAKWVVSTAAGWQVWSIERRENLLEDQSMLNRAKQGKASARQLFDYYLGFRSHPSLRNHFRSIPDRSVEFAKGWGMRVAVQDLRRVIARAAKLGGKVVLGGHSLGGAVVTAYATWNFRGRPGADGLAGLVYIDGGSRPAVSTAAARDELRMLDAPTASPWLSFGGIAAPFAGLLNAAGSTAALIAPNQRSLGQASGLLPPSIVPPVPVTNAGQYGYALNVGSSPMNLIAAQAHLGRGVGARGPVHGWDGTGALTPLQRYAMMFSGIGTKGIDGTEWYFPQRLTDDTSAVANGIANPAQHVLHVNATLGRRLPKRLRIYAFGAALGRAWVLAAASGLAHQSHIPRRNLTLVNRQATYAHNDPAGAYPRNVFFAHLVAFLRKLGTHRR